MVCPSHCGTEPGDRKGRIATLPRFCAGAAVARAAKNEHGGRNRFAYARICHVVLLVSVGAGLTPARPRRPLRKIKVKKEHVFP